jgi:hypothetical protein
VSKFATNLAAEFLDPTDWTNWVWWGSIALCVWMYYN